MPNSASSLLSASVFKPLLFACVFLSFLFNPMHLVQEGSGMEVNLDWQVLIKLAVSGFAAMMGAWGLLELKSVRRAVFSLPSVAILAILVLALPASVTGSSPSSLPGMLINMAYVMMVATALVSIGLSRTLVAGLLAIIVFSISSWLLYLFAPIYGVFPENLGSVVVNRLGGMSHPNMVGRYAGMGLVISFGLWRSRKMTIFLFASIVLLLGMTLIYSVSRTVMVALTIGLFTMFLQELKTRNGLRFIAFGLFCVFVGVIAIGMTGKEGTVFEKLGSSVAKTGDSRELTTGTGRSVIWVESVRLIKESPVIGYGFGAAQDLLEEHSQSTHNMVLNAAFIGGVVAGAIMLGLYFWLLFVAVNSQFPIVATIAVFLMVSGLVEDTVLETFPSAGTMFWIICCIHPLREGPTPRTDDNVQMASPEPAH